VDSSIPIKFCMHVSRLPCVLHILSVSPFTTLTMLSVQKSLSSSLCNIPRPSLISTHWFKYSLQRSAPKHPQTMFSQSKIIRKIISYSVHTNLLFRYEMGWLLSGVFHRREERKGNAALYRASQLTGYHSHFVSGGSRICFAFYQFAQIQGSNRPQSFLLVSFSVQHSRSYLCVIIHDLKVKFSLCLTN
jgi:hypothetical protein